MPLSKVQETYDAIRAHFTRPGAVLAKLTPAEQRERMQPVCVYRKDGDRHSPIRCAAGVRIPDELYKPEMENVGAISLLLPKFPELALAMGIEGEWVEDLVYQFLSEVQGLHDAPGMTTTDRFVRELDSIARSHKLEVPATANPYL